MHAYHVILILFTRAGGRKRPGWYFKFPWRLTAPPLWMNYGPGPQDMRKTPITHLLLFPLAFRGLISISPRQSITPKHPWAPAINGFNAGLYFTTYATGDMGFRAGGGENTQHPPDPSCRVTETGPRLVWWSQRPGRERDHCWLLRILVRGTIVLKQKAYITRDTRCIVTKYNMWALLSQHKQLSIFPTPWNDGYHNQKKIIIPTATIDIK